MKEAKLEKIVLKNYMGIDNITVNFSDKTEIKGKNAIGKSTLMNAYFDVMTGKMSNGAAPNNICPKDEEGNELSVDEISRTIVLNIDGEEHEIEKNTKRKYRKDVYMGSQTTYKINGESAKSSEVNDFISKIAPAETIAMCSNASVFLGTIKKSTADARKTLESLSGFDLEEFCNRSEEYRKAYELTAGNHVEDKIKTLKTACKSANNDLDRLNVELDYEYRCLDHVDNANLEKLESEKSALEEKIKSMENLKKTLDESVDHYTYLLERADKIRKQIRVIENEKTNEQREEREQLLKNIREIEEKIGDLKCDIYNKTVKNKKIELEITEKERVLKIHQKDLSYVMGRIPDSADTCIVCGQRLPDGLLKNKLDNFEQEKEQDVKSIENEIKVITNEILFLKDEYRKRKVRIKNLIDIENEKENEKTRLKNKLDTICIERNISDDIKYSDLQKKLKKTEEEADKFIESAELRRNILKEIDDLKDELNKKIFEINSIIRDSEQIEIRIEKLKNEIKEHAQIAADIERSIDILQQFSISKNHAIEDMVNSKFDFIKIKMSEETMDGTIKETLKIMVDGVDYFNGLNHGDRILAEIHLLKGLQDMNGIKLPIWVDDTESIDNWRLPDVYRQLIAIRRTDDERMIIC